MQAEHAHTGSKGGVSLGPTSARLGGARADFVAGLGRKVVDLRSALVRVKAAPDDTAARKELRRKLHALGSASKMMKFDAMDRAIAEAIGTLDRSAESEVIDAIDVGSIDAVIEDLPALAWGDDQGRSSGMSAVHKNAGPKVRVLVVGSSAMARALLEDDANSTTSFTCESTPEAPAAYDLVRTTEPDLIVLDADLEAATELVSALMDDPLTETVPIVVVGSFLEAGEAARYVAMGVAKTVGKPTSHEALRLACEDTLAPEPAGASTYAILGEPTLEELGDRLAAEIRDAIVGRADPSARSQRIPLGQGTEVLGAVWGAIARVREVVTARSDGNVRFARGPAGALTPASFIHEPDVARSDRLRAQRRDPGSDVRLEGRRIIVVDDDPGVVWFLADLLKTTGCIVHEAFDGQRALELAYETSPDLVISDILMPKIDGFSLCRALRRDVVLRDTPVILLSWKEDLLQRVRELGAGAAGYVRKESDTRAIISRVREALRERARVEARLREEGEVRGRLDGVSLRTLLDVVCTTRPDARVSVRDASFLYEVEIRSGAPRRITRTDGDGSFLKGSKVLAQLLGVSAGRFTVTTSTSHVEVDLEGDLAAQISEPIARARAAMALLTGSKMHAIARVRLDETALLDYLKATPERARLVARRLANGASPRELLCGGCEPALLDDLMRDLSARGLVIRVEGANGEDLLLPAINGLLHVASPNASSDSRGVLSSLPPIVASEPPPNACRHDGPGPLCASPTPGTTSSLEEAVLQEVLHGSPEPRPAVLATADESIGAPTEPTSRADLGDADDPEASLPIELSPSRSNAIVVDEAIDEENPALVLESPRGEDLTPFVSVTPSDEPKLEPNSKRRIWPLMVFVAASGIVAWAGLRFTTSSVSLPKVQQQAPLPETTMFAPTSVPTGAAPENTNATHDVGRVGTSRPVSRGVADGGTIAPAPSVSHPTHVRKPSSDERGCTIDGHTSHVAHVKF